MRLSSYILSLFLLIQVNVLAQTLEWFSSSTGYFYKIDFETKQLSRTKNGLPWSNLGVLSLENVEKADLISANYAVKEYKIENSDWAYLLISCTNQVYQINKKQLALKRIDETYYRGANCLSHTFYRNGILYSFGGYGFWTSTNILTKYNADGKEWLSIQAKGDVPPAITMGLTAYVPSRDRFITMGNHSVNDTDTRRQDLVDWNIYEYNFSTSEFVIQGSIELEEIKSFLEKDIARYYLFNGRYFFLLDKSGREKNYDTVYIIDVLDDFKTYCWKNTNRLVLEGAYTGNFDKALHINGDTLIWTNLSTQVSPNNVKNYRLMVNDVLREADYLGKLNQVPWYQSIIEGSFILVAIGFIVLAFFLFQKWKKKRLSKQLKIMLGENEKMLLDFLILNYTTGYISGHQIIAFFGKHKSSPESQRQFRAKMFENLTKSLRLLLGKDQILDVHTDEKDQRMFTYRLNPDVYQILKSL
ncbi:hypothetical protein [Aquirufa aurantiipilula]|uniref:DUF4350 domain-containing protein n=1 Tax=Aquirufa aurantiipilula TaxID=2696561 RepID=A0ABT6BKU4_9BACT|nr:hypothetical protein [Aquirufa aurantiipilula]MDF5690569.1 hypothetical protein [Aquirufa aurantiipilula]